MNTNETMRQFYVKALKLMFGPLLCKAWESIEAVEELWAINRWQLSVRHSKICQEPQLPDDII